MHEDWTVGQTAPTDRTGSSSTPDVFVVSGSAAPPPTHPVGLSGAMTASAMGTALIIQVVRGRGRRRSTSSSR
jgi:hypothetical protein